MGGPFYVLDFDAGVTVKGQRIVRNLKNVTPATKKRVAMKTTPQEAPHGAENTTGPTQTAEAEPQFQIADFPLADGGLLPSSVIQDAGISLLALGLLSYVLAWRKRKTTWTLEELTVAAHLDDPNEVTEAVYELADAGYLVGVL